MSANARTVIECRGLERVYSDEGVPVHALAGVDFTVAEGDFVSLAGPSGSGKSTLLNCIGGLDRPTSGTIAIGSVDLGGLSTSQLADLRLHQVGFVFQSYNLVPVLSSRENVEFIMQLQGIDKGERRRRAIAMLDSLGIAELAERRPGELSGGQQQRVAVARAIVSEPVLLLADEPSANLDSKTTATLLELLSTINRDQGMTIVTATHDPAVMAYARRQVHLQDGLIVSDSCEGSIDDSAGRN